MGLIDTIPHLDKVEAQRPLPRATVDEAAWRGVARDLKAGRWTLLSLWAELDTVHIALFDETSGEAGIVSHAIQLARFPSIGASHPPAIRFERAIRDLFGLEPTGLWDLRPWLDFGAWDVMQPLAARPEEAPWTAPFIFLPA